MVWLKSVTCITACILLVQSTLAVPLKNDRPLIKRGSGLSGKFLHITDIHLDPYYKEGADPDDYCHTYGKKRSKDSGKYGALGTDCDSPKALVDATFAFLKKSINDVDFIIYTGDTVRHDRDDNLPRSQSDVINGHKSVMKYFQSTYDIKNTPYIPTIGNNDAFDHNDVTKEDKIFSHLDKIWNPLGLSLGSSFSSGGYFAQEVLDGKLSIININSMYFFEKNDEVDDCDEGDNEAAVQMKWLESTLEKYSKKGGDHMVYIMGHVPPIDDDGSMLYKEKCYKKYFNLLGKHGDIIAGHFTGHTNNDNLNAIVSSGGGDYDFVSPADKDSKSNKKLKTAVGGLFNAPSIIPVNNPGIRVYEYQTSAGDYPVGTIRDWKQYYVDLEKANDKRTIEFELEYTASKFYGVDHFDGAGVGQAVMNVAGDGDSRDLYNTYSGVSS